MASSPSSPTASVRPVSGSTTRRRLPGSNLPMLARVSSRGVLDQWDAKKAHVSVSP
jgi:hypothetical protein